MNERDDAWLPVKRQALEAEKISRPSLTYWQDVRRRLAKNRVALASMIVLLIVILLSIVIPEIWRFSYNEQRLIHTNLPPFLDVIEVDGLENYIYKKRDNRILVVGRDGEVADSINQLSEDLINQINVYEVEGKEVTLDYSVYITFRRLYDAAVSAANSKIKKWQTEPGGNPQLQSNIDEQLALIADWDRRLAETPTFLITVEGRQYSEATTTLRNRTYIWGSDNQGRDLFVRVMYGGRISLLVGLLVAILNFFIGVTYGGIAGYFGGQLDNVMMRIVDAINSVPMVLYVILLMVVLEPSISTIIIALSVTYWVRMARIVRAQILSLKEQEFVLAARVIGAKTPRIIARHLVPNAMGAIMVAFTMQIPSAIFTESFLSFIGIGISPPATSWGALASDAQQTLLSFPYQILFPCAMMSITLLAINLFGDGLRDALDPRLRK